MNLDIMILTTSSRSEDPFIHLHGNITEIPGNLSGPPLILGNYTNVHYQSLIPHDHQGETSIRTQKHDPTNQIIPEEEKKEEFIFVQNGMTLIFKRVQLGRFECPICNQEQSSIGNHIKKPGCKIQNLQIDRIQFDRQLESFKEGFRLQMNRRRKQKSRAKLLEEKRSRDHQSRNEEAQTKQHKETKRRERSQSCHGRVKQPED